MQFSSLTLIAASAAAVSAFNVTETNYSTQEVTISSCGPEVTDCPYTNKTVHNVTSTFEGAAAKPFAFGAAALAAGALLAL